MSSGHAHRFTVAEITYIVRCSGRGLTARQATTELNARFGFARSRGSVIKIAREEGARFGHTKVHSSVKPRPPLSSAQTTSAAVLRHEHELRFCFQPPIPPGDRHVDLKRRAGEPEPRGPRGEFGRGCRWIHGEPRSEDWQQCDHKRLAGKAYCADHYPRTIRPAIAARPRQNKECTK